MHGTWSFFLSDLTPSTYGGGSLPINGSWRNAGIHKFCCIFICLFGCCIFRCLVQPKMMVNENYFQFDRKSLFNFWKTIYSCKSFSGFIHFIIPGMLVGISYCRALKFVGSPNLLPKVPKLWYPIVGFQQNRPESGQPKFRRNYSESDQFVGIRLYCAGFRPTQFQRKLIIIRLSLLAKLTGIWSLLLESCRPMTEFRHQ
jgi:hypothetical protein